MNEILKLEVWIRTDKVGSRCSDTIEMDREEWEQMDDSEKEDMMRDIAFNWMDWGYEEIE